MEGGMDGDYGDIIKLIETRVATQVSAQIASFAKNLAGRYRMNIHHILECYPGYENDQSIVRPPGIHRCQGVCGKGKNQRQCSRNAKSPSTYCLSHAYQGEQNKQKAPAKIVQDGHNHAASVLFSEGCPGCMKNTRAKPSPQQQVIDLGLLC
jgi:hypothetical protein